VLAGRNTYEEPAGGLWGILNQWVTTKYSKQICDALTEATHCRYFMKKYCLTQTTYNDIDWTGMGRAWDSLPLSVNLNLTKMLNGWFNTGKQLTHMHQTGKCPSVGSPKKPNSTCSNVDTRK
jgi:hypothetical protein